MLVSESDESFCSKRSTLTDLDLRAKKLHLDLLAHVENLSRHYPSQKLNPLWKIAEDAGYLQCISSMASGDLAALISTFITTFPDPGTVVKRTYDIKTLQDDRGQCLDETGGRLIPLKLLQFILSPFLKSLIGMPLLQSLGNFPKVHILMKRASQIDMQELVTEECKEQLLGVTERINEYAQMVEDVRKAWNYREATGEIDKGDIERNKDASPESANKRSPNPLGGINHRSSRFVVPLKSSQRGLKRKLLPSQDFRDEEGLFKGERRVDVTKQNSVGGLSGIRNSDRSALGSVNEKESNTLDQTFDMQRPAGNSDLVSDKDALDQSQRRNLESIDINPAPSVETHDTGLPYFTPESIDQTFDMQKPAGNSDSVSDKDALDPSQRRNLESIDISPVPAVETQDTGLPYFAPESPEIHTPKNRRITGVHTTKKVKILGSVKFVASSGFRKSTE